MLPYQDPNLDIEQRLDDLISRMTLEELILQTDQFNCEPFAVLTEDGWRTDHIDEEKMDAYFGGNSIGTIGTRNMTVAQANQLQRYAVEKTRLGIPFLISQEGVHNASTYGSTVFPQQIGLAATFDPANARAMGHAIAAESRSRGIHEVWSPVMDLMRDPRFGRTEEA